MEKKLEAEFLATSFDIPMTRTRKIKKNDDQEVKLDELGDTFDNWKGRGNNNNDEKKSKGAKGSQGENNKNQKNKTLFFNRQNMSQSSE